MDPNANLIEQLTLAKTIINDYESRVAGGIDDWEAVRLCELVIELNKWITNGGALPKSWIK